MSDSWQLQFDTSTRLYLAGESISYWILRRNSAETLGNGKSSPDHDLTCTVPFIRIQGKPIIAPAAETANGVSAAAIGAQTVNHFALVDICRDRQEEKVTLGQVQSLAEAAQQAHFSQKTDTRHQCEVLFMSTLLGTATTESARKPCRC